MPPSVYSSGRRASGWRCSARYPPLCPAGICHCCSWSWPLGWSCSALGCSCFTAGTHPPGRQTAKGRLKILVNFGWRRPFSISIKSLTQKERKITLTQVAGYPGISTHKVAQMVRDGEIKNVMVDPLNKCRQMVEVYQLDALLDALSRRSLGKGLMLRQI